MGDNGNKFDTKEKMRASTSIRLDSDTKEIAAEVFKQYGVSLSDSINLFCKQVAMTQSIPFELKAPSERMQKVLDELAAKKGKKFDSMYEFKKDLPSWDILYFVPPL